MLFCSWVCWPCLVYRLQRVWWQGGKNAKKGETNTSAEGRYRLLGQICTLLLIKGKHLYEIS